MNEEFWWLRARVNSQQQKRLDKVFAEEYFVLEHSITDSAITITITGSTQNVYSITIDKASDHKTIRCNCPDSQSFSLRFGCMCKHCCFVVIKICKWIRTFEGWQTHTFTPLEIILLEQKLNARNLSEDRLTNSRLQTRYNQLKQAESNGGTVEPISIFDSLNAQFTDEDECPICYDLLSNGTTKCCPTCHNHIHLICIQRWLQSKPNCVLCRSEVWQKFLAESRGTKSSSSSAYLQL